MKRTALRRGAGLQRHSELSRTPWARSVPTLTPAAARKPIRAVSVKRARENRQRREMADRRWPDRREGTVMCAVWEAMQPDWCDRFASDLHEILPRGRSGSITDEANTTPTCRPCNGVLTESPAWAYRLGFLKHDGVCCEGRRVCAQYAEGSEAA